MRIPKDFKPMVNELKKEGWTVEVTKGMHHKIRPPSGRGFVIIPSSPSDWRGVKNFKSLVRRLRRQES